MDRLVRAFPLLPGQRPAFEAFAEAMRQRREEVAAFYRGYGIVRESWHLQESPAGDIVICCTDIEDLHPAARAYGAATGTFDTWFKAHVRTLCGIDPDQQPLGPPCQTVFDWPPAA